MALTRQLRGLVDQSWYPPEEPRLVTLVPVTLKDRLGQAPLPSFRRPPVVEVVIGVQLAGTTGFSLESMGRFASALADEGLPVQESKPAIPVRPEHFDPKALAVGASLDVLLGSGHPPVCHVLRSPSGDEMVQIQQDWMAVNWRKTSSDSAYPRWPSRWETFNRRALLAERHLGNNSLKYGLVEVTYVNHIELDGTRTPHSEADRVFAFLNSSGTLTDGFLSKAEQCQAELTFLFGPASNAPSVGRLNVSISPGWSTADMRQIFVMTLTARGRPDRSSLRDVRGFADLAREWIVRAFSDLTTPYMHEVWAREDPERSTQ